MVYGYGGTQEPIGTFAATDYIVKPPHQPRRRRRLDLVAMCLCLFVPWIFFTGICALLSFSTHHRMGLLCWVVVFVGLIVAVIFGVLSIIGVVSWGSREPSYEPKWFVFLFITTSIAVVAGAYYGNQNFILNMQRYYDLNQLNVYVDVSPAQMRGQQLMDAGRVEFVQGAELDLSKSKGFRNVDVYCVTPITVNGLQLATYDFWAVGLNCCQGDTVDSPVTGQYGLQEAMLQDKLVNADFQCGPYTDNSVHSGLRLMRDDDRAFYRLAVQEAEAAYNIKAVHPLFFFWDKIPENLQNSYKQDGYSYFLGAIFLHFAFQLTLVSSAGILIAKFIGYQ